MDSIIHIPKDIFLNWAKEVLVEFDCTEPRFQNYLVIRYDTQFKGIELHIYTNSSERTIGRPQNNCIDVIVFDRYAGKIIKKFPPIKKIGNSVKVFSELEQVLASCSSYFDELKNQEYCEKCQSLMVVQKNKDGTFYKMCGAFQHCKNANILAQKYPLKLKVFSSTTNKPNQKDFYEKKEENSLVKSEDTIQLVDEDKVSNTSEYSYLKFPFEKFNRVQSAVFQSNIWKQQINLICGTATSTGKTVVAELAAAFTLSQGKKVIYVSPLKSLTQEKYSEWKTKFSNYKIEILTGDYVLSNEKAAALKKADIFCLTSEMIDSRTRNHTSEKSEWLYDVGLVIVDETHIISTERGHAVEVGLMRFSALVPKAKIWLLSATVPNVADFQKWLVNLNGLKSVVINSSWRPSSLEWHFIETSTNSQSSYKESQQEKIKLVRVLLQEKEDEKYLVFVHDKATGRMLEQNLTSYGINCKFHNADVNFEDRLDIENSFSNRSNEGLRVLISTSTLAWGRTLPARNVIIVGTTRGITRVDELDIIQMAGRAGRFGVDPKGDCYFICDNEDRWRRTIANPRRVISTLLQENILAFHILAEIKNQIVTNRSTLDKWFDRSLAKIQLSIKSTLIDNVISKLVKWGMIFLDEKEQYSITQLGLVSATLYFLPNDVHHWHVGFSKIQEKNKWDNDVALSYVLGTTPGQQLPYVPRSEIERVRAYQDLVRVHFSNIAIESMVATDFYDLISGHRNATFAKTLASDIDRIAQALSWIDQICKWNKAKEWKALVIRCTHGVGRDLVELCSIPGVGVARAQKLLAYGIQTVSDIKNKKEDVKRILGIKIGNTILKNCNAFSRLQEEESD